MVEEWIRQGRPIPPPHKWKQQVVSEAQKESGFRVFIETGTYQGDMVAVQINNFEQIISIEINNRFYVDAMNRFAKNNNVRLIYGNSGELLYNILAGIKESCIFWLDGHYFRPEQTPEGEKQSPVLEELNAILLHPYRHIILIDDMRLFDGVHYPTIEQVKEKMKSYNCEIADDIMKLW